MAPVLTIKDPTQEVRLFRTRVVVAVLIVAALTAAILGRMVKLQVLDYEHFKTLSEDNRVNIVPVPPIRGLIFDRNGVVLAQNTPTYSLEIVPEAVEDLDAVVTGLRDLLQISDADVQRFQQARKRKRPFESVPLRLRLTPREVARFSVNRHLFPGVDVHARLSRSYPLGPLAVHLVGYVGRINERELQRIDATNYRGTTHIGKTGVEQSHEDLLHGTVGFEHVETNAFGRTLRVLERRDPVSGDNLYLTIDAELQAVAEQALGDHNGSIVAIEPATGAVLAFASMPGFDPNLFVDGIERETYRKLLHSPDRPLFNRALNGQYPPGSTVKPFLALAGLENGSELSHKEAWCPGFFRLPGRQHRYRDWKKGGHGRVGLERAITESCDVFFYELAQDLGIDHMHDFMVQFGFGVKTGIDLVGESDGLMPSSEWKRRVRNQPWYPGETLIAGIGQGFTLATPLQLATATATLAMHGLRPRPRVVHHRTVSATGESVGHQPEFAQVVELRDGSFWSRVVDAMVGVVHGRRGTARRVGAGAAYRMAGKTGTAQVIGVGQDEEYDADAIEERFQDHGLFIAFAPVEKPRIAVAILVENGGSGSRSAAPIARKVLDHYLVTTPVVPDGKPIITARSR